MSYEVDPDGLALIAQWLAKYRAYWPPRIGQQVRYRLRDDSPPFLESTVFTITPNATGGTCLRIVHELTDATFDRMARAAASSNSPPLMLAA